MKRSPGMRPLMPRPQMPRLLRSRPARQRQKRRPLPPPRPRRPFACKRALSPKPRPTPCAAPPLPCPPVHGSCTPCNCPAAGWSIPASSRLQALAESRAREAAAARRRELNARGIDTDRPGAALEPGLSLGRFSSEDSANRAVADFARRGISGLRVVRERRDTPAYLLRLPAADAALREKLTRPSLRQALAGKPLRPCD